MLNALQVASADFNGVIVFTAGGKAWTYGTLGSAGILIAVNDDFTVVSNRQYASTNIYIGTSDGSGNAYFLGEVSSKTILIKVQESDYNIMLEKEYGHIA